MFSTFIELFFKTISAEAVTELFLYFIIAAFFFAIYAAVRGRYRSYIGYAATLMTSIGILGTFVGIVIGLLAFDTADIDGSIPALLEGLKTAFITSVFGMGTAITFNFLESVYFSSRRRRREDIEMATLEHKKDVSAQDIYNSMEMQNLHMTELRQELQKGLERIHSGLSGAEDGSLVGQLKLLRMDLSEVKPVVKSFDNFRVELKQYLVEIIKRQETFKEKLFESLERFADMLSKSATEQVIEALKNVIQDFNKHLVEQFGENFKALDESVKKLVIWQEQYKQQVEKMGEQYEQSVGSLVETREAVSGIWQECENIPKAMDDLREVIVVNQHQISELQRHLEAFVTMRDKAVEAVPTIHEVLNDVGIKLSDSASELQGKLLETSEQLLKGSDEMRVSLVEGAEQFRDSVQVTQQSFNELSNTVKSSSENLSEIMSTTATELHNQSRDTLVNVQSASIALSEKTESIVSMIEQSSDSFNKTAETMIADLRKSLSSSQEAMNDYVQGSNENVGKIVNSQMKMLEEAIAKELSSSINQMSNLLAQVTQHFIRDYKTMVSAMEEVINSVPRG